MPNLDAMIHVCSLARLHEIVEDTGARHVVSLIGDEANLVRPQSVAAKDHLWLRLHDISTPLDGYIMPGEEHVAGFPHRLLPPDELDAAAAEMEPQLAIGMSLGMRQGRPRTDHEMPRRDRVFQTAW